MDKLRKGLLKHGQMFFLLFSLPSALFSLQATLGLQSHLAGFFTVRATGLRRLRLTIWES